MFRKYGVLGLLMVIFAQLNFFIGIQPFASWYFPIIWFGYILLIDAIIYKLRGHSLISNRPKHFVVMLFLSATFWWFFETVNFILQNWYYTGIEVFGSRLIALTFATLSFSTVVPAIFETTDLVRTIHFFDHLMLKKKHEITKRFLHTMMGLGLVFLILTITLPKYFFPLVWIAFFLLLDPFNYLHKRPSIISHLKDRKLIIPVSLFIGGTICGFFWEFWNFWAVPQWHYSIPLAELMSLNVRVFEMPVLGYLGYGPFAWELYSMYYFVLSLRHTGISHKEILRK